jgi:hypothetical protein
MKKNYLLPGIAGLGLCVAGLVSCSADQPETRKATLVDLTHGIAAHMPVLESGITYSASRWSPASRSQQTALAYALARSHSFFGGFEASELSGIGDIGDSLGDITESDEGGSSSSSSTEAPGSGSPSTEPSVGSGELATGPGVGSGELATGPGVGSGRFATTPGLFASYGSGGVASVEDFASAYCNLFSGLIQYVVRCVDGIDADVEAQIEAAYGEDVCRESLAPAISESFTGEVPAVLVDLLNCVGDGFETASCGAGDEIETGVNQALAACGLSR